MNNEEIIFEDVLSEGYLFEMGQVLPKGPQSQYDFIVGYTPEDKKGNPYFKVYNHPSKYSSATHVIRIKFKKAEVVTGHRERNGKKEWKLEDFSRYGKDLVSYLNSKSKTNSNITVWTELRFQWNLMKGFDIESVEDYVSGKYDTEENLKDDDYIPHNMSMPRYDLM